MNKVEKYISDKSKELELNLTRFIQRVFPESQEIVPTLFLIDNTGQMNLVNVNQIFALSKDDLKTKCIPNLSQISFKLPATSIDICSLSMAQGPPIKTKRLVPPITK